jgi:adenylate cyclase class IV
MPHLNVEIKARSGRLAQIRAWLHGQQAEHRGTDHQVDTYFQVPTGRLKLRQGEIEQNLIFYQRPDQAGPKPSQVHLYHPEGPAEDLLALLSASLGVWQQVRKTRDIYFIDNVKFHLDEVEGLGTFVEIEAIDIQGDLGADYLRAQCDRYLEWLHIQPQDLVEQSYSDLLSAV